MGPLQKVQPGDSLGPLTDSKVHNAFVDAAADYQARMASQAGKPNRNVWQASYVKIHNDSGASRVRFDVLGIDGPLFTPAANLQQFKNQIVLKGVTPIADGSDDDHKGRFVILMEPARTGEIVAACAAGVCVAKIDILDVKHRYAELKDDDATQLQSTDSGPALILFPESGTGLKWSYIRIDEGGAGRVHRRFELKTCLEALSTSGAWAYQRPWAPSANGGEGDFVKDVELPAFKVYDWTHVGYFGDPGAEGACEMWKADNGWVGVIYDLSPPENDPPCQGS